MKLYDKYIWLCLFLCCFGQSDAQTVLPNKDLILENLQRANAYWQANNTPDVRSFWDNAAYHTGNMEAYFLTLDENYLDYSTRWAEHNNWQGATGTDKSKWTYGYDESPNGVLFGDWQICFQTYIDLYNMEPDEIKVARAREVMGYQVTTDVEDYWWWADGLYMVMPVMMKMYKLTGEEIYLQKLYEWFKYAKELMYDGPGGIPCSADGYTTSATLKDGAAYADSGNYEYLFYRDANYVYPLKTVNGIKNFWARGCGWVFAGLAKVLKDYPETYAHYDEFKTTYLEMAAAIVACQKQDEAGRGFWTQSMLADYPLSQENPQGYETSGTAFMTYGLFWGLNNGLLDEETCLEPALRGWKYLSEVALQESGKVGHVQPVGAEATQATPYSTTQNFGVGAFLLAACEAYRYVDANTAGSQPYVYTLTGPLEFTWKDTRRQFILKAFNLVADVRLTAPEGITVSPAQVAKEDFGTDGVVVTVDYDGQTPIEQDSIRFMSEGAPVTGIRISADPVYVFDFPEGMFLNFDQSITRRAIVLADYLMPDGVTLAAPDGISLSKTYLTQQEMAGDTVWAIWDGKTRILDGHIAVKNPAGEGSIDVFAVQNLISTWDGDNATGPGSKLTDFGWTVTQRDGVTPAEAVYNEYGVSAGVRYLPPWEEYTYNGVKWTGERIAFLRWQRPDDVFNLPVYLPAGKYVFRGLLTWNTNGRAPVIFKVGVNTAKSNTGTMLGSAEHTFQEGFQLADYEFGFTVLEDDTYYLTVAPNQGRDVICGVAMLCIYQENEPLQNDVRPCFTDRNLHLSDRMLHYMFAHDAQISVCDLSGRLLKTAQHKAGDEFRFRLPVCGIYLVVLQELKNRKVIKISVR